LGAFSIALDAEDVAAHDFVDSIDAAQLQRSNALGRRLDTLGRRLRSLDTTLGLPACVRAA
jgi:hypothetical protein